MLKIRSKYIIKRIFDNLMIKKSLLIMKINKKLQNKIDYSIKDYIEYNQIEIDLKLIPDYSIERKIININNKDIPYVHIYYNNNKKKENNDLILKPGKKVEKIKIKLDLEFKSLKGLFKDCSNIKSIKFIKFNRNNFTDMSEMFSNCINLTKLDISKLNTNQVTNMKSMFQNCSSLKKLNVSNFNTNKVLNMDSMFNNCTSLIKLDLSKFNTSEVENMSKMFFNCVSLFELNVSSFKTSKVNDMSSMFEKCKNLIFVNVSNFIINEKCTVNYMFSSCQEVLKDKIKKQNKNIEDIAFINSFDIFSFELIEVYSLIDFKEQEEDQIIFLPLPPTKINNYELN